MEIELSKIITGQMALAAQNAYPGECCGILLGKHTKGGDSDENSEGGEIEVMETREAPNQVQGAQKNAHFSIDPLFLYQVEQEIEGVRLEVVGFYHSHPDCDAVPSDEDYEKMVPGLAYVILSVSKYGVKDIRSYKKTINY